jgi:hypothetical protein
VFGFLPLKLIIAEAFDSSIKHPLPHTHARYPFCCLKVMETIEEAESTTNHGNKLLLLDHKVFRRTARWLAWPVKTFNIVQTP